MFSRYPPAHTYYNSLWVRRPLDTQYFIVMAGIRSVQDKRCKLANEVIWGLPNLYVWVVGYRDIPNEVVLLSLDSTKQRNARAYFPSGENWMSFTGFLKLWWCSMTPLRTFTSRARPSKEHQHEQPVQDGGSWHEPSSTLMRTFESGLSAMTAMFFRFSNGKVYDLLLWYGSIEPMHAKLSLKRTWLSRTRTLDCLQGWTQCYHQRWR